MRMTVVYSNYMNKTQHQLAKAAAAKLDREAMASGMLTRSVKFTNRKRLASRQACRKGKGDWS